MAGPGIRYWELAHALAERGHAVTLVAPTLERASSAVRCRTEGAVPLGRLLRGQDAVLTQWVTPPALHAIQRSRVPLVIDAYDPMQLETLEADRGVPAGLRQARHHSLRGVQNLALLSADAVVCASERQRDLWLGALMALGRISPEVYDQDDTLRNLVDVVPFGCPVGPPQRIGAGPRERFGLAPDDVVVLWGGGIWDWLDPLVLLRAVADLRQSHPRLKLVFMGLEQPTPGSSASAKARATEALADELGLRGTSVFFAYGWVPYEQRQSFLLDADAGISAHLDHAETRFAFRTRVLDYLWAGLPCLLTEGDALADLVAAGGAGSVQPFGDVAAWREALGRLVDDPAGRSAQAAAARRLADAYRWPEVARALEGVLDRLAHRSPSRPSGPQRREVARYTAHGAAALLRSQGPGAVLSRLRSRAIF